MKSYGIDVLPEEC